MDVEMTNEDEVPFIRSLKKQENEGTKKSSASLFGSLLSGFPMSKEGKKEKFLQSYSQNTNDEDEDYLEFETPKQPQKDFQYNSNSLASVSTQDSRDSHLSENNSDKILDLSINDHLADTNQALAKLDESLKKNSEDSNMLMRRNYYDLAQSPIYYNTQ